MFRPVHALLILFSLAGSLSAAVQVNNPSQVVISVRDQKLMVLQNGTKVAVYPVSTSKYGLGDFWGRMTTPLGYMQVAQKIGDHAPIGAVFHNRRFTGEVLRPNAPGRDPVITRIIWLRGLEPQNAHAFSRCIYIHGTPEERTIGHPASYGCIRMKSNDVAALYNQLPIGALVQVVVDRLPNMPKASKTQLRENAAFINAAGKPVQSTGNDDDWMNSARSSAKPPAAPKKNAVVAENVPRA